MQSGPNGSTEEVNHLVNKPCENPSIYLLATLTLIDTPEHTILLFSNSNLGIGGIELVLAPLVPGSAG